MKNTTENLEKYAIVKKNFKKKRKLHSLVWSSISNRRQVFHTVGSNLSCLGQKSVGLSRPTSVAFPQPLQVGIVKS
jgi:hypothetical protein